MHQAEFERKRKKKERDFRTWELAKWIMPLADKLQEPHDGKCVPVSKVVHLCAVTNTTSPHTPMHINKCNLKPLR